MTGPGPSRVERDVKIEGPYRKNSGYRCRVVTPAGRKWCPTAQTPEDALRAAELLAEGWGKPAPAGAAPEPPADELETQEEPELEPEPQQAPDRKVVGPMRVEGPYSHRNGYRCRVVTPAGRVWCTPGKTEHHAWKIAERFVSLAAQQGRHSVQDAITAYLAYQAEKGNRPGSIATTGHVLRRFFGPVMESEMARLTPQKGTDLYDRIRKGKGQKTRKPIAVDTHRNYLLQARSFLGWCAEQGWLKLNPLEKVKPVGQRSHGKAQLTIDEARRLYQHCMREAPTDDGALAVLLALGMGLRASEIVTRTVRDLDDNGKLLRVEPNDKLEFRPKTKSSHRPAPIPADLQPLLVARTKDKLPTALLFVSPKTGGPHWRDWVTEESRRLCKAAGVRAVCAHALRGVAATSAAEAGVAAEAIARLLGHESASITKRSYIAPGTAEKQEREQVQQVLSAALPSPAKP